MPSIEVDADEIVDAIIANPELITAAFRRMKEGHTRLITHADRQQEIALLASERARQNEHWEPLICSQCGSKTIALWEGDLCADCSQAASAIEARSGETAQTGSTEGESATRQGDAQ